jgi:hypothetical protein
MSQPFLEVQNVTVAATGMQCVVARWFIRPKIPIWVYFGGPWNWYILWPFGVVCGMWYILPVLVCLDQEKSGNPDVMQVRVGIQKPAGSNLLTYYLHVCLNFQPCRIG